MPSERNPEFSTRTTSTSSGEDAVAVHPVTEADATVGRVAIRLTTEFFLRTANLVSRQNDGDLIEGLILLTIITANRSHLDQDRKNPGQYVGIDDIAPDELSRPVSILAVSGSLGMPYETVRRCVNRLLKSGACVRMKGGLIVPSDWLHKPWHHQGLRDNMVNLRRFLAALKRAGIEAG